MTEAERQQVIDALELLEQYIQAYGCRDLVDIDNAKQAIAIMRREPKTALEMQREAAAHGRSEIGDVMMETWESMHRNG